jgi:hypothetical protein
LLIEQQIEQQRFLERVERAIYEQERPYNNLKQQLLLILEETDGEEKVKKIISLMEKACGFQGRADDNTVFLSPEKMQQIYVKDDRNLSPIDSMIAKLIKKILGFDLSSSETVGSLSSEMVASLIKNYDKQLPKTSTTASRISVLEESPVSSVSAVLSYKLENTNTKDPEKVYNDAIYNIYNR